MSAEKIKVIHIIWSGTFGGIEKLLSDLCQCMQQKQLLKPSLLICKMEEHYFEKFLNTPYPIHFGKLNSGNHISIKKLFRIYQWFRKSDILHFHCFNPMIAFIAFLSRKKIIYTEHGTFGKGRKQSLPDYINRPLKSWFLKWFTGYTTFNSVSTRKKAEKIYRLPPDSGKVIYNGMTFANHIPEAGQVAQIRNRCGNRFTVGTACRFVSFKRIDRLIESFIKFNNHSDATLLLVGDGPLMETLKKYAEESGIGSQVVFPGYKQDVANWVDAMDVFVLPSHDEPFGIAALEAMALGKPVLVFKDGGGVAEIISGVETQNVVEDVSAMTQRIEYFYRNQSEASSLRSLRINASKQFDILQMQYRFIEIYSDLLTDRNAKK